jgi:hypothetical protein
LLSVARWTNIDGSAPDVVIGYNWQKNELFLTGDLAAYNAATGNKAIAVVSINVLFVESHQLTCLAGILPLRMSHDIV